MFSMYVVCLSVCLYVCMYVYVHHSYLCLIPVKFIPMIWDEIDHQHARHSKVLERQCLWKAFCGSTFRCTKNESVEWQGVVLNIPNYTNILAEFLEDDKEADENISKNENQPRLLRQCGGLTTFQHYTHYNFHFFNLSSTLG